MTGKVALVTGGSRGIGAETVRLFCAADARVFFNYRAAAQVGQQVVEQCGGKSRCQATEHSLATASDGRKLVEKALAAFGRLDILVVNHGIWPPGDAPIEKMTEGQWRETLSVNLDSVFGLVQATVAAMKQQTPQENGVRGHIVLVSSTAAQRGEAFHADYAASKGALISLTKSLSSELASQGIYVNCVAPGWIATDMSAPVMAVPETRERIFKTIPIGRIGTVREIAGPILFLCSPLAGFISGEVLNINGGSVLVG